MSGPGVSVLVDDGSEAVVGSLGQPAQGSADERADELSVLVAYGLYGQLAHGEVEEVLVAD